MAGWRIYFITEAADKGEARSKVESWLYDYLGREFYEGYKVSDTCVMRAGEVGRPFFEKALGESKERCAAYESGIAGYMKEGDLYMAGYAHVCLGRILMNSFCKDMPYWNLVTGGWSFPEPGDWAVEVVLE